MFTTENAEISDDFWKRRTRLYFSYYKRAFFIKALKYRRFGNDNIQSVSVVFHGAFRWLFLFTIKNHLCADEYAAAVCAIKSTQLKQGRTTRCVTSTQELYPSLFGKRFNLCRSQNDAQNTKAFSQQTIHAKIKRNNHMDQTALILTQGLTTAALQCTVRPLFFFFLTKSQPFNKKQPTGTINHIKQSEKTIQNLSINNTLKTKHNKQTQKTISSINRKINHKNYHNKQSTQSLKKTRSKQNITNSTTHHAIHQDF